MGIRDVRIRPIPVLLFLLLCIPMRTTLAQEKRLQFLDEGDGKPISGAVVTFYASDSVRAGYGFTDKAGLLSLKPSYTRAAYFIARKMGYAPLRIPLPLKGETFFLSPKETTLPAVTVTRKPIRMEGDTIVYEAAAFLKGKDASLGDLLRRLPGIKVEGSGSIEYQGEPIKKLYIEGMDLLGSRYNTATKNLSAEAVSRIEVLENHQDIKMLRGIVPEKKASLNIRLKEQYKFRPFGYLEGGADHRAEAFLGHLNLVQVAGKKLQYFGDLKGNSMGDLYSSESQEVVITSEGIFSNQTPETLRSVSLPGELPLPKRDYIRNAGGLLSGNALIKAGEERDLRINVTAFGEMSRLSSSHEERYTTLSDPVVIREETSARRSSRSLSPTLTWTTNAKGHYFTDKLSYTARWEDLSNAVLLTPAAGEPYSIDASPSERMQYASNTLYGSLPSGRLILSLSSYLRGSLQESRLVPFGEGSAGKPQLLKKEELLSQQSLSFDTPLAVGLRLSNAFAWRFTLARFSNDGLAVTSGRYLLSYTPTLRYTPGGNRLNLSLALPVTFTHHALGGEAERSQSLFALNPSLSLSWQPDGRNTLLLTAAYSEREEGGGSYFPGKLYLTHRFATENPLLLTLSDSWDGSFRWRFRDLYRFLFANLSLLYTRTGTPLTQALDVTAERTTVTYLDTPSSSEVFLAMGDLSKNFADFDLDLKLSADYSRYRSGYLLNGSPQDNLMQSGSLTFTASWSPVESLSFENAAAVRLSGLGAEGGSQMISRMVTEDFSVSWSPLGALSLRGAYGLTAFPGNSGYKPAHMLSAEAVWKVSKEFRLSLSGQNLLGTEGFREERMGRLSEVRTLTPLLPFRLILSAKWSFK